MYASRAHLRHKLFKYIPDIRVHVGIILYIERSRVHAILRCLRCASATTHLHSCTIILRFALNLLRFRSMTFPPESTLCVENGSPKCLSVPTDKLTLIIGTAATVVRIAIVTAVAVAAAAVAAVAAVLAVMAGLQLHVLLVLTLQVEVLVLVLVLLVMLLVLVLLLVAVTVVVHAARRIGQRVTI